MLFRVYRCFVFGLWIGTGAVVGQYLRSSVSFQFGLSTPSTRRLAASPQLKFQHQQRIGRGSDVVVPDASWRSLHLRSELRFKACNQIQQRSFSSSALYYRELDEDDNDTTMLKVQTRAPIGFDMRQAVRQNKPDHPKQQSRTNALNMPLIRALELNQIIIVALATVALVVLLFFSGDGGLQAFSQLSTILDWSKIGGPADTTLPLRLLEGIVGALPLLVVGNWVESSDQRAFANINFSTIVMTMTLFGRRRPPPDDFIPDKFKGMPILTTSPFDVFGQSLLLSTLTGICEETVFRLEIPAFLTHVLHFNLPLAIASQALLFGLGHAQPRSSRLENSILIGLQFINGINLGLLYVLTGGDILPCMVAHALYDLVTFFKTWSDANGQLEYAEQMYLTPLPPQVEMEVRRVLDNAQIKLDPMVFKVVKRLFYIFDFDKNKTLSKSEVRKGVSYLALEKTGMVPPQQIVDMAFEQVVESRDNSIVPERDQDRLSFSDFVRLYATMYDVGTKAAVNAAAAAQMGQSKR